MILSRILGGADGRNSDGAVVRLRTGAAVLVAVTSVSVSLAACGGSDDGTSVAIGAVLEPTSLDLVTVSGAALDQVLLDNVYETLLDTDADGNVVSGLAEVPTVSDDGLSYTFKVRDGVAFHDGDPMTADDIAWSLDAFRGATSAVAAELASIASVEAVDDSTVVVTLAQRDNGLLFSLTRRGGAVLDDDTTDMKDSANGTGPFTLASWNVGSSIDLERNDAYWGAAPSVSGATFYYFTDANAAVNALTTGEIDVLTGASSELVLPLAEDGGYTVTNGGSTGEMTLGFNHTNAALSDVRVRTAIRRAIDKEAFLELGDGFGTLIGGPVPPSDPWYEDLTDVAPFDPAAARELLAEAGHADGLTLTMVFPNIYSTTLAEFIVSQLAEVGITVEVETVEFSVWLDRVYAAADYDLTFVIHIEPRDIVNYANPGYYWRYDSAEVQQLISDARAATDQDEANDLLRRAARKISEDAASDWLALFADIVVAREGVSGYPANDASSRFDASRIVLDRN